MWIMKEGINFSLTYKMRDLLGQEAFCKPLEVPLAKQKVTLIT